MEAHVMASLHAVLEALCRLRGAPVPAELVADPPITFETVAALLAEHANSVLGPAPQAGTRIMMTMPGEAADVPGVISGLLAARRRSCDDRTTRSADSIVCFIVITLVVGACASAPHAAPVRKTRPCDRRTPNATTHVRAASSTCVDGTGATRFPIRASRETPARLVDLDPGDHVGAARDAEIRARFGGLSDHQKAEALRDDTVLLALARDPFGGPHREAARGTLRARVERDRATDLAAFDVKERHMDWALSVGVALENLFAQTEAEHGAAAVTAGDLAKAAQAHPGVRDVAKVLHRA